MRECERETLRFRIDASRARADWALARAAMLPWWAILRRSLLKERARAHLDSAELDQELLLEDARRWRNEVGV